uniref:Uncharacterized protein n=1 Tax=Glossina pallidipes TaxID=7398 RepID=A0A1A9ZCC9_GLOPL
MATTTTTTITLRRKTKAAKQVEINAEEDEKRNTFIRTRRVYGPISSFSSGAKAHREYFTKKKLNWEKGRATLPATSGFNAGALNPFEAVCLSSVSMGNGVIFNLGRLLYTNSLADCSSGEGF